MRDREGIEWGSRPLGPRPLIAPLTLLLTGCLLTGCAEQSRLWRIQPFTAPTSTAPASAADDAAAAGDRINGFPLLYSAGGATAVLWPLMDFDARGFAVRPLLSKDGSDWDVLFPLSHFDADTGDGWWLTAYSCGDDAGLFPLFHVGPEFNYAGPAWWRRGGDGSLANWGLFPIAWANGDSGNGLFLNAYRYEQNVGLFPLLNFGPKLDWIGPAWWRSDESGVTDVGLLPIAWADLDSGNGFVLPAYWSGGDFGLFPLFHVGDSFDAIGPFWRSVEPDGDATTRYGMFPLVWGESGRQRSSLLAAPLWYQLDEPGHSLCAALLPPIWWEDEGAVERHFVLPFYACLADTDGSLTVVPPLFAAREADGESEWWTLLANGWSAPESTGLNVYPLWWSSTEGEQSSRMLLPLFYERERGDERLLLTPLGGYGWDASGTTAFTNVLGPLFHHSRGPGVDTTALLWPLFERETRRDPHDDAAGATTETRAFPLFGVESTPTGHDAWFLAGLGRDVDEGAIDATRLWPLWSSVDGGGSPDLLFDLTLAKRTSGTGSDGSGWSHRLFPLVSAKGDARAEELSLALGLGRVEVNEAGHAWRLWPLASASTAASADGWLDDWTLFRHETRPVDAGDVAEAGTGGQTTDTRLFPLFDLATTPNGHDLFAACGLLRHRSNDRSSAFRLWPLWSQCEGTLPDDPLFELTLAGHREDGDRWSNYLFPFAWTRGDADSTIVAAALGLARVKATDEGHAWRLWPVASASTDAAADGWLDDWTLARYEQRDSSEAWRLWPLWSDVDFTSAGGESPDLLYELTLAGRRNAGSDWSNHLFPLWRASGDNEELRVTALAGLARVATTDAGHAWRLFPIASASTDAAADGWLDEFTLARFERREPLARDGATAWRVWPLASKTASEAPRGTLDLFTLVGFDRDSAESSLHVGTPLVFDLDRRRDGSGWEARVLSLLHFGREEHAAAATTPGIVERRYAGFLFDWFKAEERVVANLEGATHEESHFRLPLLHEYENQGERTEWDALCYAVHSVDTPDESRFSVLGYAYRSVRTGDSTQRDIFPFITCDDAPDRKRVSFLWRLFEYERQGDQVGGHLLFIPWGDAL